MICDDEVLPLPSSVAGIGPYSVQSVGDDTGVTGYVVNEKTGEKTPIFGAPANNELGSIAVRAHEYGHLALERLGCQPTTPEAVAGIHNSWVQAVLDMQVNAYMLALGSTSIPFLTLELPEMVPDYCIAQYVVRSEGLYTQNRAAENRLGTVEPLKQALSQMQARVRMIMEDKPVGTEELVSMARNLQSIYGPEYACDSFETIEYVGTKPRELKIGTWGIMSIHKPPLTVRVAKPDNVHKKFGYIGSFQRPLHSLIPSFDGECFRKRIHIHGSGTLLIDMSGSMNWNVGQLISLIRQSPSLIVAGYSSTSNTVLDRGVLRILAENGECVSSIQEYGVGNVIDGPALDWLSTKPEPRVWISDEEVTGVGDHQAYTLNQEVLEKLGEHKIIRVSDFHEAMGLFSDLKK